MRSYPKYWRYWGKARPESGEGARYHLLPYHCLDVAAVGAAWWEASPSLCRIFAEAFQIETQAIDRLRGWVLFFLALHDIGKLDLRFQLKAPETLQQTWPELDFDDIDDSPGSKRIIQRYDHGLAGCGWAKQEGHEWFAGIQVPEALHPGWHPWIEAVTGHHGDIPRSSCKEETRGEYAEAHLMEHDRQTRCEFVTDLAELFLRPHGLSLASPIPECEPGSAAQALLAGFCSVCDWIGSNTDVIPYASPDTERNLRGYFDAKLRKVREEGWLERFGVIGSVNAYGTLAQLLKPGESPRGVQMLVDNWPIAAGLMLIEAPTGSGKTETALAHAWQLLEQGTADSIVFALPTQATANAMLSRAVQFSGKAFSGNAANVVLAHGKSDLHEGFNQLVAAGQRKTAQECHEAGAQCAAWLAQSRKKVFLGQIGICTVDQVLLSVLPVRHKFVRSFGINKSVLIVDEVHAYDSYMHSLLAEVLRRQKATGGSAILLSATLPSGIRNKFLRAWDADGPEDAPYPAVWRATTGTVKPDELPPEQYPEPRTVGTELLKSTAAFPDDRLISRITEAAEAGARVAVICNLVDDAQRLAHKLRKRATRPVDIFHARYRFADRQVKETAALECYGRDAVRNGGRILVATQVIEQSLDLDFDWMITQICPADLLFQRLGRLHRHLQKQPRPESFSSPRCTVLSVEADDYGTHKLIYGNTRVLWRTEKLLERNQEITFPAAYRHWLTQVYTQPTWDDEPDMVFADYRAWKKDQDQAEWDAEQMISMPRKAYSDDDTHITVKTRDGEMSLTVLPIQADGRLLSGIRLESLDDYQRAEELNLNGVPVPSSWEKRLKGCPKDDEDRYLMTFEKGDEDQWVARMSGNEFRYSAEFGMEKSEDG